VVDLYHRHGVVFVVDLAVNSVGSTTSRPEPAEFTSQGMPDPSWGLDDRANHELDDSRRHAFR
jgi:hypothetical protein